MGQWRLQFGDKNTADIKLNLTYLDGEAEVVPVVE